MSDAEAAQRAEDERMCAIGHAVVKYWHVKDPEAAQAATPESVVARLKRDTGALRAFELLLRARDGWEPPEPREPPPMGDAAYLGLALTLALVSLAALILLGV